MRPRAAAVRGAEAGQQFLRHAGGPAIGERHEDHTIARRIGAVPGAVLADDGAVLESLAEGGIVHEGEAEGGGMRAKGKIGLYRLRDQFGFCGSTRSSMFWP